MASKKQIEANRKNAQRSTGPRTITGKEIAKINSLRHGLTADQFVLPSEDPAQLAELRRRIRDELQPEGWLEEHYVENVIVYAWRLRRVHRIEAGLLTHFDEASMAPPERVREAVAAGAPVRQLPTDPEAAAKDLEQRLTKSLGLSFLDAAVHLQLLSRYETAIYRKLRDSLTAFESARAARLADEDMGLDTPERYR